MKIKPIWIDGFLVIAIACCGFSVSYFDNEDSFKYVNVVMRFWLIYSFGFINAGCGALLFLRKNSYAEHAENMQQALKQMDSIKTLQPTSETVKTNETIKL